MMCAESPDIMREFCQIDVETSNKEDSGED